MERYYQQEIETADREQILAWQNERLVKQVRHVWDNVPYYRAKMEEKWESSSLRIMRWPTQGCTLILQTANMIIRDIRLMWSWAFPSPTASRSL